MKPCHWPILRIIPPPNRGLQLLCVRSKVTEVPDWAVSSVAQTSFLKCSLPAWRVRRGTSCVPTFVQGVLCLPASAIVPRTCMYLTSFHPSLSKPPTPVLSSRLTLFFSGPLAWLLSQFLPLPAGLTRTSLVPVLDKNSGRNHRASKDNPRSEETPNPYSPNP